MNRSGPSRRKSDAGVTLIEMMIALALFALIGSAGFAILDQVLRAQRGTEGRLERLSDQQRAMHLILADFSQADPRSVLAVDSAVSLQRGAANGSLHLRYRLTDGTLLRDIADGGGTELAAQTLLSGVEALSWRFLTPEGEWSPVWPADPVQTLTTPQNPRAVELSMTLQGNGGELRRVAPLPVDLD